MENRKNEQVIYLKDLLFVLLRGWRILLIAAVVLAAVLGSWKLYKGVQEISAANAASAAALPYAKEQYALQLEAAEEALEIAQKERDKQEKTMENSIWLRLDPDEYYVAEITCYVQVDAAEESQDADKILKQYVTALKSASAITRIAKTVKEEFRHLREVYYVESDEDAVSFRVVCSADTETLAKNMLSAVKNEIADAQEKVTQLRGEHTLLVDDEAVTEQASAEIKQKQQDEHALLDGLEARVEEAEAAKASVAEPIALVTPRSQAIKPAVKYAILGALVGMVAVAAYLWLRHVFGGKVYSARVLSNVTSIKLLGCVAAEAPKNPIDRWLYKLEGRETENPESRIKLLAADIRNRCGEKKELLLTGEADSQSYKAFVQALAEEIPGIRLVDEGSLLREPAALEALCVHDAVLLVEQCGSSTYDGVQRELDTIADYGKTVIGCVLLGG